MVSSCTSRLEGKTGKGLQKLGKGESEGHGQPCIDARRLFSG